MEVTGCKETKSKGDVIMLNQNQMLNYVFFMKTITIMNSCVSILQSRPTSSSPVVVEMVDVVEVIGCKGTK